MAHEIPFPIPSTIKRQEPWHVNAPIVNNAPVVNLVMNMTLPERIRSLVDRSKADLVKVVAPDNDASCRRQYRSWTKGQLVVEALRQDGFLDDDDETVIMSKRMDE